MKRKSIIAVGMAALMSLALLAGCGSSTEPQSVSTNGSTSMEKVIGALSEKFMETNKDITVTYDPTGSGTGIESVSTGKCDIGLSSRALKDSETGLTGTTIALDGIAIIVNADNKVADLSVRQIADIFTGKITNWKDVGGNDAGIVVVGREAGSGTRDGFESVTGTKEQCKYRQELTSTGDVIAAAQGNPNAIGYASTAAVGKTVKTLTVGGIEPTEANVKNGSYVVQRPFILVTKEGKALSAEAQKFFNYATSKEAAEIIIKAGAVPAAD